MFKKLTAVILAAGALFAASAAPKVTLSGKGADQSFDSIQAALNSIKDDGSYTIKLPKGTYEEVLYYKGPATIKISGDTKAKYGNDVVIAKANDGDMYLLKQAGSAQKGRCLFEFDGTGNLILENVTLHNTYVRGSVPGANTQAEAFGFDSTGYVAAYNCGFISTQDTIRVTGKCWFYKCFVEGDTDFIWMETLGKVALFEECDIHPVNDPKHGTKESFVGAPRMPIAENAGKGLVILNSQINGDEGQTNYLGRTPWKSGYLNQIAVVNTKCKNVTKQLWQDNPLMSEGVPRTVIGWKIDAATAKSIGVDTKGRDDILSADDAKNEFNGRQAILNRYYDGFVYRYKKDAEDYLDIDGIIAANGWKVSKDKSSALLKGETEDEKVVYALDGTGDVSALKCEGFALEEGKPHFAGAAGSSITVPVKGKCLVTVTGYYAGSGTIKAGKQGEASFSTNTASTSVYLDKTYVVYEGATDVVITAAEKTYITSITVVYDKNIYFKPVESISVTTGRKDIKELPGRKTLQMSAILNPGNPTNKDYVWSVDNEAAAMIEPNGVLTAKVLDADTTIKVRCTSKDEKAVYGEKEVKILMPEAGAFSVTWLADQAACESLAGVSDDPKIGKAVNAKPSAGVWKYNSSKITADVAKGALTYSDYSTPVKGREEAYIDFPIVAQEKFQLTTIDIAFGNHGTGNVACYMSYSDGNKNNVMLIDDDTKKCRSTRKTYKFNSKNIVIEKGQTLTVRVALYGTSSNEIPTGKAPTIGTITVNGKQVK